MLWRILVEFLFRMSFGLALWMSITSAKQVTAGFFRVHLWVLLGLNTFAACVIYLVPEEFLERTTLLTVAAAAAITSYVGAVVWLYEQRLPGKILLLLVAGADFWGGALASQLGPQASFASGLAFLDYLSSGLLVGSILAAMFLGHWYLNTPTMKVEPLERLIAAIASITCARAIVCGLGLAASIVAGLSLDLFLIGAVVLRWLAGIVGIFVLAIMARQTLRVPNTQSATGILYVAVIFVFIGELVSRLLSARAPFPL
jgi:hypothetical protein